MTTEKDDDGISVWFNPETKQLEKLESHTKVVLVDDDVRRVLDTRKAFFEALLEVGKKEPVAFLGIVYETAQTLAKVMVKAETDFGIHLRGLEVRHVGHDEEETPQ